MCEWPSEIGEHWSSPFKGHHCSQQTVLRGAVQKLPGTRPTCEGTSHRAKRIDALYLTPSVKRQAKKGKSKKAKGKRETIPAPRISFMIHAGGVSSLLPCAFLLLPSFSRAGVAALRWRGRVWGAGGVCS